MVRFIHEGDKFVLYDDDTQKGYCRFSMLTGEISELVTAPDTEDVLRRTLILSAMNAIDLFGRHSAFSSNNDIADILDRLGFKKDSDNVWRISLEGYFDAPCEGEKKK